MATDNTAEAALTAVCQQIARLSGSIPVPSRVRIQMGDVSVEMEWPAERVDVPPVHVATPDGDEPAAAPDHTGHNQITAPTVGTFYRAPEPGAPPFVRLGDRVEAGQQVGILEAMKLMNAIVATEPGTVVDVLVQDGTPVEYDQPLIVVAADAGSREAS